MTTVIKKKDLTLLIGTEYWKPRDGFLFVATENEELKHNGVTLSVNSTMPEPNKAMVLVGNDNVAAGSYIFVSEMAIQACSLNKIFNVPAEFDINGIKVFGMIDEHDIIADWKDSVKKTTKKTKK